MSSSVVTDVPSGEDADGGGGCACGGQGVSASPAQFCCEPKTILRYKPSHRDVLSHEASLTARWVSGESKAQGKEFVPFSVRKWTRN